MDCPKCGHANKEETHQCSACGIIFIKWLIRQNRIRNPKRARAGGRLKELLSLRLPREYFRTTVAASLLTGAAFGFLFSQLDISGRLPRAGTNPGEPRIPSAAITKRTRPLLKEARALARRQHIGVRASNLEEFFREGYADFNKERLVAAALAPGSKVPARRATVNEFMGHLKTPFRCRSSGPWTYFKQPPSASREFSECWGLVKGMKGSAFGSSGWTGYWARYAWIPKAGRWALFSPAEERALLWRRIFEAFGPDAVRKDVMESKRLLEAAGSSKMKRKEAVLFAFKTRVRRLGALYRLENPGR